MVSLMSKLSASVQPFVSLLPKNHPAYGSMMMNFAANMLGLDNAATPMGLKAMDEMQSVNPQKTGLQMPRLCFLCSTPQGLPLYQYP